MKIKVTQEDIDKSIHRTIDKCPVALAVKRSTHRLCLATADSFRILVNKKLQIWRQYLNPPIACRFVNNFDAHSKVEPFEFEAKFERILEMVNPNEN